MIRTCSDWVVSSQISRSRGSARRHSIMFTKYNTVVSQSVDIWCWNLI